MPSKHSTLMEVLRSSPCGELPCECDQAVRPALASCSTLARSSAPCSQEHENVASFLIMVSHPSREKD